MEAGYCSLQARLCPMTSAHLTGPDRDGTLQVPSLKQQHLAAPRRHVFSVAVPVLWNSIPPNIGMA